MKTLKNKTVEIDLGYIHMDSYKPKSPLTPRWWKNDPDMSQDTVDPKELVLKEGEYSLEITYPLTNPFNTKFKVSEKGFSRRELVKFIIDCYQYIYKQEESEVGDPGNIPGMLNRARSSGSYGIWGHGLGDLMLHTAYVEGNKITVDCDS
jgi:hypothetical protein